MRPSDTTHEERPACRTTWLLLPAMIAGVLSVPAAGRAHPVPIMRGECRTHGSRIVIRVQADRHTLSHFNFRDDGSGIHELARWLSAGLIVLDATGSAIPTEHAVDGAWALVAFNNSEQARPVSIQLVPPPGRPSVRGRLVLAHQATGRGRDDALVLTTAGNAVRLDPGAGPAASDDSRTEMGASCEEMPFAALRAAIREDAIELELRLACASLGAELRGSAGDPNRISPAERVRLESTLAAWFADQANIVINGRRRGGTCFAFVGIPPARGEGHSVDVEGSLNSWLAQAVVRLRISAHKVRSGRILLPPELTAVSSVAAYVDAPGFSMLEGVVTAVDPAVDYARDDGCDELSIGRTRWTSCGPAHAQSPHAIPRAGCP